VNALEGFDTNFKMLPPLREETDRQALITGLKDGTIDAVVSNHCARHGEEKELEFPYADFGALGMQTAFRQALAALDGHLNVEQITAKFSVSARLMLGFTPEHIKEGNKACLTLFTTDGSSEFTAGLIRGKTLNSPLIGQELPGEILGVINNDRFLPS